MGMLFAKPPLFIHEAGALAALVFGNFCLVAYVFVLNDWAGIEGDLKDPNRTRRTFVANGHSRTPVGYLAFYLLILSFAVIGLLGPIPLILSVTIALLGTLYSAPGIHWKGQPLLNSALHFGGGALHFLLGYTSFTTLDVRGMGISCFFGLVFTAGHFTQEVRDHDGDKLNAIRTNAVVFGKTRTFFIGFAFFTAAYTLLALLAIGDFVPFLLVFSAALYPFHLFAALRAFWSGLTFEGLRQLQRCYRILYALIGLLILFTIS